MGLGSRLGCLCRVGLLLAPGSKCEPTVIHRLRFSSPPGSSATANL